MPRLYSKLKDDEPVMEIPKAGQDDFSGGMASSVLPTKLGINQGLLFQNCILTNKGFTDTRLGVAMIEDAISSTSRYQVQDEAGNAIKDEGNNAILIEKLVNAGAGGLGFYQRTTDGDLVAFIDGFAWKYNGGTLTPLNGYTYNGNFVSCCQYYSRLWALDGSGDLYYYDGTSFSIAAIPPGGVKLPAGTQGIFTHDQRVFAYGIPNNPDQMLCSNIFLDTNAPNFDPNVWGFRVSQGGKVIQTAISWHNKIVAAWYADETWAVDTTLGTTQTAADFTPKRVDPKIGCIAKNTPACVGDDIFFLAKDGVRKMSRNVLDYYFTMHPAPISNDISDWIAKIAWQNISCAFAYYRNSRYVLWVPIDGSSYPNCALVWCTLLKNEQGQQTGGWEGVYMGYNPMYVTNGIISGIDEQFVLNYQKQLGLSGDYKSNNSISASDYKDFGADIETVVHGRAYEGGEPANLKAARQVEARIISAYGAGQNITVYHCIDGGDPEPLYDPEIIDEGINLPVDFPVDLVGASWQSTVRGMTGVRRHRDISFKIVSTKGRLRVSKITCPVYVKSIPNPNSTN